jgi:hypothetical protein
MTVPWGSLISLPTLLELDDVYAHWHRRVPIWKWERMVTEAFETLYEEGSRTGRLMVLSLHPWCIGQPHRIKSLEGALKAISRRGGVWLATARQVHDWYVEQDK